MVKKSLAGYVALLLLAGPVVFAQENVQRDAAIVVTHQWLASVDAGNAVQSWQEAAEYFKTAVSQEQWGHSLTAVRQPLGKLLSRNLISAVPMNSLPGAPDGTYSVIQFESSFENKQSAVETVTLMLEQNGVWRVAGYYIK